MAARDMAAIRQIQQFRLQQFAQEDEDTPMNMDGLDPHDCTNDLEYITRQEWDNNLKPTVKIYFEADGARPNVQCFDLNHLQNLLETDLLRLWVPNTEYQQEEWPIEETGHGGMPSVVERYSLLPDGTLVLTPQDMAEGEYRGIPLYRVRYGNRYGTFGVSESHGQHEVMLYALIPRGDSELVSMGKLLHSMWMRYGEPAMPTDHTVDAYLETIRKMKQESPIPVRDVDRTTPAVSEQELQQHQRDVYLENLMLQNDPEGMINKVVSLLRTGYSLVFSEAHWLVAPTSELRRELLALPDVDASNLMNILSNFSPVYTVLHSQQFANQTLSRHLSDADVQLLLDVYAQNVEFREMLDHVETVETALTWEQTKAATESYLEKGHTLAFRRDPVAWRWTPEADDDSQIVQDTPTMAQLAIIHSNMVPEYIVLPVLREWVAADLLLTNFSDKMVEDGTIFTMFHDDNFLYLDEADYVANLGGTSQDAVEALRTDPAVQLFVMRGHTIDTMWDQVRLKYLTSSRFRTEVDKNALDHLQQKSFKEMIIMAMKQGVFEFIR